MLMFIYWEEGLLVGLQDKADTERRERNGRSKKARNESLDDMLRRFRKEVEKDKYWRTSETRDLHAEDKEEKEKIKRGE